MSVQIRQIDGTTFTAMGPSGHWVVMDSSEKVGGSDGASRPMEMVLMALGGCTGIDVISILSKMKVTCDDFQIRIFSTKSDQHPKVFTRIHLRYAFYGNELPLNKIEKAVGLSREKYCSVSAMLGKSVNITHEILLNPPQELLEKEYYQDN